MAHVWQGLVVFIRTKSATICYICVIRVPLIQTQSKNKFFSLHNNKSKAPFTILTLSK